MDVLKELGIPATFFVLGHTIDALAENGKRNRKTIRRMIREGHTVGSHSYSHPNFAKVPLERVRAELELTGRILRKALGVTPRLMRPPEGDINEDVSRLISSMGLVPILWNVDTKDWKYGKFDDDTEKIMDKIESIPPGGIEPIILLQHDTVPSAVKKQREIIATLLEKGYRFVSIFECLGGEKPYYS